MRVVPSSSAVGCLRDTAEVLGNWCVAKILNPTDTDMITASRLSKSRHYQLVYYELSCNNNNSNNNNSNNNNSNSNSSNNKKIIIIMLYKCQVWC